ncbi:hypothetical protein VE03_09932 [Pseudogymnoascus sp. 23342-1-I1]|nr:hypothetical protein VE03_09932 [Pseudogymnoascus sp. 23342-1-I1]
MAPPDMTGATSKDAADATAKGTFYNEHPFPTARSRRVCLWTLLSIALFVILGIGLGFGLGYGLKKPSRGFSSPATDSDCPCAVCPCVVEDPRPTIPTELPPWRLPDEEYHLGMDWDLDAAPTTRVYNFTVQEIQAAPDGVLRTMITINGKFPGPMIRANRGDRLMINVTNELSEPTSIHWHGMFQYGSNWMDGTSGITQCPIPPGRSFVYDFLIDGQYGTYWYHAHFSTQYTDGMVGPLIIHAPEEAKAREEYDHDEVIMLQDWYHDLSKDLLPAYLASGNENKEPTPDNGLIQGTNTFNCSLYDESSNRTCETNSTNAVFGVTQGSRYRYRLINVGAFAGFHFSVDNHTITVIEADATTVEPVEVHRLSINIAQRYSVIVSANQPEANYFIRADMITTCFAQSNPVLNPLVLGILSYTKTADTPSSVDWGADAMVCQDLNSTLLTPSEVISAPPADIVYPFAVSFQIGAYALDRGFFNDTTWKSPTIPTINQAVDGMLNAATMNLFPAEGVSSGFSENQLVVSVPKGKVVDLLIQNLDDGAHPFHLHGHEFWVMAQSPVPPTTGYFPWETYDTLNTTNPLRRDTLTIGPFGYALLRFEADHQGLWAFHCHISWHMEAGLLMQFMTGGHVLASLGIPDDVRDLCNVDE